MIGLLIVAHENLGESLIACATHVLGTKPERLLALDILATETPEASLQRGLAMMRELDAGEGVLVMTDVFGATPSNVACKLLDPVRAIGVSGVNLPMLLRAITYRSQSMETLIDKTLGGARESVMQMPFGALCK